MQYRVEPITFPGCECDHCAAGRHLYLLYRIPATGTRWSAMSLRTYASAEECKEKHPWGIQFHPGDTWEDGAPVIEPEQPRVVPSENGMVALDPASFGEGVEVLENHLAE